MMAADVNQHKEMQPAQSRYRPSKVDDLMLKLLSPFNGAKSPLVKKEKAAMRPEFIEMLDVLLHKCALFGLEIKQPKTGFIIISNQQQFVCVQGHTHKFSK